MTRTIRLPDGRKIDLDYFVEWRPWLWRRPVRQALRFLGDLRGKRVLEVGGRRARMAALFALLGAHVTMLERHLPPEAEAEVEKWGVAERVRLVPTKGGVDAVQGEQFDVLFTKSVLWSIEDLSGFLDGLAPLLAPGGKAAFLENYRGGRCLFWLRRHILHRGAFGWEKYYHGIRPDQLPLFRERFARVRVKRYLGLVYGIFGEARPASGKPAWQNRPPEE